MTYTIPSSASNHTFPRRSSLHNLRIAEVVKLDMKIEGGKVVAYRSRLNLSFKIEQ
jgi:flavin-binding protein dodecin